MAGLSAGTISFKKSVLSQDHVVTYNAVTSAPQTHSQLKATLGATDEQVEHRLSMLVDEGMAKRLPGAKGDRTTATYQLA